MPKQNELDPNLAPEYAEGWKPKAGDVVEGKVTDVDSAYSTYTNSLYPIVTIQKDDGTEVSVHGFHTVLKKELLKRRPKIGEAIRIVFVGMRKMKNEGMEAAIYKVTTESGISGDIWNAFHTTPEEMSAISEEPPF